jgi:hypothetical protein
MAEEEEEFFLNDEYDDEDEMEIDPRDWGDEALPPVDQE